MDASDWAELAEVKKASKVEFEPEGIDPEEVITDAHVLDPGMANFRASVLMLNRSKQEIVDFVRELDRDGLLQETLSGFDETAHMFHAMGETCAEAQRRLAVGLAVLAYEEGRRALSVK